MFYDLNKLKQKKKGVFFFLQIMFTTTNLFLALNPMKISCAWRKFGIRINVLSKGLTKYHFCLSFFHFVFTAKSGILWVEKSYIPLHISTLWNQWTLMKMAPSSWQEVTKNSYGYLISISQKQVNACNWGIWYILLQLTDGSLRW